MKQKIIGPMVFLVGVLAFSGASYLFFSDVSFISKAEKTTGTVIKLERPNKSYFPIFSYVDHVGEEHEVRSSAGASPPAYSIDERVTVYYLKDHPGEAIIGGFFSQWFKSIALGGMAVLLIAGRDLLRRASGSKVEQPTAKPD